MDNFKVTNREVGYSFIIKGSWKELKKESYEKFGIQGNVLHFFIEVENGMISKAININRDPRPILDEEEYAKVVALNLDGLRYQKYDIVSSNVGKTKDGRRVDKIIVGADGALMVLYFTMINHIFMTFSTGIKTANDEADKELSQIVASLKAE